MQVKLRSGDMMVPVEITEEGKRLFLNFGFVPGLKDEVKSMDGAKWHGFDVPPRKQWSIKNSARNRFRLEYLKYNPDKPGMVNPYARYDLPLQSVELTGRPYYAHQKEGVEFLVTRRQAILGWEMGCIEGEAEVEICTDEGGPYKLTLSALYQRWGKRKPELPSGRIFVKSWDGKKFFFNSVFTVLDKGNKSVIVVTFSSGVDLAMTPDHEVLLEDGTWVRADQLKVGNRVRSEQVVSEVTGIYDDKESTQVYDIVCDDPHRNFVANGIVVHNCGKTLIAIGAMEWAKKNLGWKDEDFLYIGPKAALYQVMLDYEEWKSQVNPQFMSYEAMVKMVENWRPGRGAPKFVVFDESTKIKSPTAKRSECALYLADAMRQEYGPNAFVVLMTGSPAPKNPADWWHQAEVACPGFIREGNYNKFRMSLALIEQVRDDAGGGYPKLRTWYDDEKKCKKCGLVKEEVVHSSEARMSGSGHIWEKSENEVAKIYSRLKGFASIKFKRDCIDLPEKVYRTIKCKPTQQVLNAARLIGKRARTAVQALTLLRELSDGFQYKEEVFDSKPCVPCGGTGTAIISFDPDNPDEPISQEALISGRLQKALGPCETCQGRCEVDVIKRTASEIACPKDDALIDLIEEHEDVGRLATYAGFTGSVDRIVKIYLKMGWHVVKVDGRGWQGFAPPNERPLPLDSKGLYKAFRYGQADYPKVGFVAQASSAGHGINLTATPTMVFWSNDFNFESRIQAEARNDRLGIHAVLERSGRKNITIVDLVHLDADALIISNHKKKRTLQSLTLGEVQAALEVDAEARF